MTTMIRLCVAALAAVAAVGQVPADNWGATDLQLSGATGGDGNCARESSDPLICIGDTACKKVASTVYVRKVYTKQIRTFCKPTKIDESGVTNCQEIDPKDCTITTICTNSTKSDDSGSCFNCDESTNVGSVVPTKVSLKGQNCPPL